MNRTSAGFLLTGSLALCGVLLPSMAVAEDIPEYAITDVEPDVLFVLDGSFPMAVPPTEDSPSCIRRAELVAEIVGELIQSYDGKVRFGLAITSTDTPVKPNTNCQPAELDLIAEIGTPTDQLLEKLGTAVMDQTCADGATDYSTGSDSYLKRVVGDSGNSAANLIDRFFNARKDWDLAFTNDTPNLDSVYEIWESSIGADPDFLCRKRSMIFVVGGGESVSGHIPKPPWYNGPSLDTCIDDVGSEINAIQDYVFAEGAYDHLETYVMGFNLETDASLDYLNEIAEAGETNEARSANSREEFSAIMIDVLNRILAGQYSGAKPVLDTTFSYLFQPNFVIYDPATEPEKHAWEGHLRSWQLDETGSVVAAQGGFGGSSGGAIFDSAEWLMNLSASGRDIYSASEEAGGVLERRDFRPENLSYFSTMLDVDKLDVNCDGLTFETTFDSDVLEADAQALINFVRRDSADSMHYLPCTDLFAVEDYRLLDIHRSSPRYVGLPAKPTTDEVYRNVFVESQKYRDELLVVGSNGGMLHGFQAKRNNGGIPEISRDGRELWSYVPRHILPRLGQLFSESRATLVDATASVADVKYERPNGDPEDAEWKTVAIVGDGFMGSEDTCEEAMVKRDDRLEYACGHYTAVSISTSISSAKSDVRPLWEFMGDGDLIYTAAPAAFATIRLNTSPVIRDVAVLTGRGRVTPSELFQTSEYTCKTPMYVVQPVTGEVIKKFGLPYIDYYNGTCDENDAIRGIRAQAVTVDTSSDLMADWMYVGDMDGQLWRFDLRVTDPTKWESTDIFYAPNNDDTSTHYPLPMTYSPALTFDSNGDILIFINTGDPVTIDEFGSPAPNGHLYVLRDTGPGQSVSLATEFLGQGYMEFDPGEVAVGEPVIAAQTVFFTTYLMPETDCDKGSGRLYALDYISGETRLTADDGETPLDYIDLGDGIPSGVVLGVNQIYVTMNDGTAGNGPDDSNIQDAGRLGVKVKTLEPIMPYGWVEVTGR